MTYEQAVANTILRTEVGSTIHGTAVADQDDRDELGVFVERPEYVLGVNKTDTIVWRTALGGGGRIVTRHDHQQPRSGPGDTDVVLHPLGKFCELALSVNPTVMLVLFSPSVSVQTVEGAILRSLAPAMCSKRAIKAFMGYMNNQLGRLTGEQGQKRTNRPELIDQFGFDTKYASHVLRLGFQGIEFAETGTLVLPLREDLRQYIVDVRRGRVSLTDALGVARDARRRLESLLSTTSWPDQPDFVAVSLAMLEIYNGFWLRTGQGWKPPIDWKTHDCQSCGFRNSLAATGRKP